MDRDELMQAAYDEYFSTGYDPTGGDIDSEERYTSRRGGQGRQGGHAWRNVWDKFISKEVGLDTEEDVEEETRGAEEDEKEAEEAVEEAGEAEKETRGAEKETRGAEKDEEEAGEAETETEEDTRRAEEEEDQDEELKDEELEDEAAGAAMEETAQVQPSEQLPEVEVVAGVVLCGSKILAAQRSKGAFKGLWEFPGGKIEAGETHKKALRRELQEELGIKVKVEDYLDTIYYNYPDFNLIMHCYLCELKSRPGDITLNEHKNIIWLETTGLHDVKWLPADELLLPTIEDILTNVWL